MKNKSEGHVMLNRRLIVKINSVRPYSIGSKIDKLTNETE